MKMLLVALAVRKRLYSVKMVMRMHKAFRGKAELCPHCTLGV